MSDIKPLDKLADLPYPASVLREGMRHIERNCSFIEPGSEDQAKLDAGELQSTDFRYNKMQVAAAAFSPCMYRLLERFANGYHQENAREDAQILIDKIRQEASK